MDIILLAQIGDIVNFLLQNKYIYKNDGSLMDKHPNKNLIKKSPLHHFQVLRNDCNLQLLQQIDFPQSFTPVRRFKLNETDYIYNFTDE